jgi:short-subunit dehydrogenase
MSGTARASSSTPLAFITGASSGLGQALADRCARSGYRLALVARRTEETEVWVRSRGLPPQQARVYGADVAQADAIVEAGERCIAELGLPDIVIASAGISVGMDTAVRADLGVMQETFAVNNLGMAATFHPFLRGMRERRSGTLVGIASVGGIRGLPGHGAYCASKAGVIAYCESLRGECRPHGVRVVTIVPGYIATPLTARNRYPMPFLMQPDDFAERALRAIEAGTSYRVIPWQMGVVAKLLRALPDALFDKAFAGRGRKRRRGE